MCNQHNYVSSRTHYCSQLLEKKLQVDVQWLDHLHKGTNLVYRNFWSMRRMCGVCCAIHQKHPPILEALQTCIPPYPLKYNSNDKKKQASLMFSLPAKRIFQKVG